MAPGSSRRDVLTAPPPDPIPHHVKTPGGRIPRDLPALSDASYVTDSTISSSSMRIPSRRGHPIAMSDRQLYKLAAATARAIRWDEILHSAESEASRWKWHENQRDFSIYSQHQSGKYAVLAIGIVPCSVPELLTVLHAANAEQHLQKMQAMHCDQFRDGALVYQLDLASDRLRECVAASNSPSPLDAVSVKTATFNKTSWLHSHEEWCYVDTIQRDASGKVFTKHMATLHPKDLVMGKSDSRTKFFHGVLGGYFVTPEHDATKLPSSMQLPAASGHAMQLTRVHFYAEFNAAKSSLLANPLAQRTQASPKAIKQRLLTMARTCERLTQLIRRRRLGVQVLVDQTRIFPPTNTRCLCCSNTQLIAKLCRLCGHGVCADCSQKHERETLVRGNRLRVEVVRVCDYCMDRVDRSNYEHLVDTSLMGPAVVPDPVDAPSAKVSLKKLLQEALVNASSEEKKASVMNVIKCVVDQAAQEPTATSFFGSSTQRPGVLLTPTSSMSDYVAALDYLETDKVPHAPAALSTNTGRTYVVDPSAPGDQMAYPLPDNEAARLKAIEDTNIQQIGKSEELTIICDLAAKELDSFLSLVTIVTQDEHQVIAANVPAMENGKFPRAEAFCAHTIMDDKPLLIPHPEADVRFHQCGAVKDMGVRYYCGFPLIAEDKTVIGSLCCIDVKSHEMTESQYAALNKLAQTATKVVRIQGNQRRSSAAMNPPTLVHL